MQGSNFVAINILACIGEKNSNSVIVQLSADATRIDFKHFLRAWRRFNLLERIEFQLRVYHRSPVSWVDMVFKKNRFGLYLARFCMFFQMYVYINYTYVLMFEN